MARKTEVTEVSKVVKLDNQKRDLIMSKYLNHSEITTLQKESAIEELCLRSDYEVIEEYVYTELLIIGAPSGNIIRKLKSHYGLTQLAASYLVNELVKHSCSSLDLSQEYTKTLINIDNNISKLNRVLEDLAGTSVVDSDIDINQLFAELRQWTALKASMINNGVSNQILKVQTAIEVSNNKNSLEDLQKQLEALQ